MIPDCKKRLQKAKFELEKLLVIFPAFSDQANPNLLECERDVPKRQRRTTGSQRCATEGRRNPIKICLFDSQGIHKLLHVR
jgi:hypothetical protein